MVTSGFFNSIDHDRRYNAEQMSALFDGIINDGVFMSIGTAFQVKADVGVEITVGVGRAWLDHAWVHNEPVLRLEMPPTEMLYDRIDAVVIEVDHSVPVRNGDIKIIKGPAASGNPVRPTLEHTFYKGQYPLAYILRPRNSTEITQSQITNMVGTSELPFVTGILKTMNIDQLVEQWWAQWDEWFKEAQGSYDKQYEDIQDRADQQYTDNQNKFDSQAATNQGTFDGLVKKNQLDFDKWFASIKYILDGDAAGNLLNKINQVEEEANERIDRLSARSQTKEFTLDSTGWYRVAIRKKQQPDNMDNIIIYLRTLHETHEVRLICSDSDPEFTSVYDKSDISYIRKIRLVRATPIAGVENLYLDIYFVNASSVEMSMTIETTYNVTGAENEWAFMENVEFLPEGTNLVLETYAVKALRGSMFNDIRKSSNFYAPFEKGWYRLAMRYAVDRENTGLCITDSFIVRIGREFQNSTMEVHEIRYVAYSGSGVFEVISEKAGVLLYTQLRLVKDGDFIALDVYYNANEQNISYFSFEPMYEIRDAAGNWFMPNQIMKVSDTPNGSVLQSYTLGSDTSGDMRTLSEKTGVIFSYKKDYTTDVVTGVGSNTVLYTKVIENLKPGTYVIILSGAIKSSGGHTVYYSFSMNDAQLFRANTNSTVMYTAVGLHVFAVDRLQEKSTFSVKLHGTGGSTATLPAYNPFDVLLMKIA